MGDPITVLAGERFDVTALREEPGIELRLYSIEDGADLTPADLQGVDAFVGYRPDLPAAAFDEVGTQLEFVMRPSAGFDNLDLRAATEHGIVVAHAPQGPRDAVVEGVIGMMISCARSLHAHTVCVRERGYDGRLEPPAFELASSTVGILGLGQIGRRLAEYLDVFGPELKAHDPYVDAALAEERGVELVSLDELLETSDILTIHVPLTEETHHLLGAEHFRRMQETAFVINAARGGVFPDDALARAVREGWIAGAVVDVYEDEPDVEGNPLLELPQEQVLVTPHILGITTEAAYRRVEDLVVEAIQSLARGGYPPNVLNPEVYDEPVPEDRISEAFVPE